MQKIIYGSLLVIAFSFNHTYVLAQYAKYEYCWEENGNWYYSSTPRPGSNVDKDKIYQENCDRKRRINEKTLPYYRGAAVPTKTPSNLPNNEDPELNPIEPSSTDPRINETVYNEQQRELEAKMQQQEQANKAQNAQYCESMRTQLAQLRTVSRLTVTEPNGEIRKIDDNERKEKIANAEQAIAENCN